MFVCIILFASIAITITSLLADVMGERKSEEESDQDSSDPFYNDVYGPPEDPMTLSEFLDFWMLLSDEQKDIYTKQSWLVLAS